MKQSRIKTLLCNCCDSYTKGRQYWNRDTGYGICPECAKSQIERYGIESVEFDNGKEGIHFNIKEVIN